MKLLKYLLNFAVLWLIIFMVFVSFGIIVEPPADRDFMRIIWNVTLILSVQFIVFISFITLINFLLERKVEKRQTSREFLLLLLMHLLAFIIAVIFCANDYYVNVSKINYE